MLMDIRCRMREGKELHMGTEGKVPVNFSLL